MTKSIKKSTLKSKSRIISVIWSALVLVGSIFTFYTITGCNSGPPPPTYYNYYETLKARTDKNSNVHGADVYWGTTRQNITNHIGTTPYNSSVRRTSHAWAAGYFKVVKRGYKPTIVQVKRSNSNRSTLVTLEPLPKRPSPPQFIYPDPKSVAITPLDIEANRKPSFYMKKEHTIAVMTFKEPAGSGAGSLVADNIILDLQVKGYNVVDREQIERVMREQGMLAKGKTQLTDLEVSKKLGKLINADYIIYGAITEYVSKSENIQLSPQVDPKDRNRYVEERDEFIGFYDEFGDDFKRLPTMPKTLQEWEFDSARNARSSYINIARVGVTAKIINIKTSDVVWVGFASLQDLRIQAGMRRIVRGLNHSFTSIP